ncbi:hypothetical protein [Limnothrix sp. PR1529]|uniref:hypothetical protein n=1 Tax=Limnothrix sp. PR1529 TaxID=1704291 RepID=UPI00081DF50D|nr:hypothetical protein [Limnothrix sp. PR1529]OCQ96127.1 hypothetical protein BCR12_13595 [Limnothrix sp. P13C2]
MYAISKYWHTLANVSKLITVDQPLSSANQDRSKPDSPAFQATFPLELQGAKSREQLTIMEETGAFRWAKAQFLKDSRRFVKKIGKLGNGSDYFG